MIACDNLAPSQIALVAMQREHRRRETASFVEKAFGLPTSFGSAPEITDGRNDRKSAEIGQSLANKTHGDVLAKTDSAKHDVFNHAGNC